MLAVLRRRLAILLGALAAVIVGSELWRRAVLRYVREPRRRHQLLLIRRIVTWVLILLILSLTFITHLSSFATFAGLLTAGLAVAMQSVLVSLVGYFILIGKYGLRVGDRVQVGNVTGEVIDLGLIRMHLLELTPQEPRGPTGRVVAIANSIVFQSSGGLFRQIPGVNFTWHELTVSLPAGSDYVALKNRLLERVTAIVDEFRGELARQAQTIRDTAALPASTDVTPQVQLQFSPSGVEAKVRYPVPLNRTAEVDERVSQELHQLTQRPATAKTAGSAAHGSCRRGAHHGRPGSQRPLPHHSRLDVRLGGDERSRRGVTLSFKQQHRGVHRFCQSTGKDELPSTVRLPREPQMLRSVGRPALQVVGHELIEEKEVHCASRTCNLPTSSGNRSRWSRPSIDELPLSGQQRRYRS